MSPVPAVVVAPLDTTPPNTARPPLDSDGSLNAPEIVDEAVEKKPFSRPSVVEVELYPATDVKLNVEKLASFVSCDVLMVDVANEYVEPLAPTPRKPVVRDGSVSVPMVANVDDDVRNDE